MKDQRYWKNNVCIKHELGVDYSEISEYLKIYKKNSKIL